jgi:acetaldehyde dehydrogenase (acetylating)
VFVVVAAEIVGAAACTGVIVFVPPPPPPQPARKTILAHSANRKADFIDSDIQAISP